MLNKTRFAVAAVVLLGCAGPAAAHAQGRGGWHHDSLFAGVTLTDAQSAQMQTLRKAAWQNNKALFDQMHAIDEKIDTALLSSGTVTEATLAPLQQQKAAIKQQLDGARLAMQIAERNLLTDAQLSAASAAHAQLASLHAQERALHKGGPAAGLPPAVAD